jgi:hyperosmotically inducible protein
MRAVIVVAMAAMLAAGGCDKSGASTNQEQAAKAPADNTKKNARDRDPGALTPGDQGGNEIDRTITQRIRQGIMKDDSLSMTAKNVKIITVDGVVTLRGPVKSDQEKTLIANLAQQTGNVKRVDNQLEIAAN